MFIFVFVDSFQHCKDATAKKFYSVGKQLLSVVIICSRL